MGKWKKIVIYEQYDFFNKIKPIYNSGKLLFF